jgi:hypothetical protein
MRRPSVITVAVALALGLAAQARAQASLPLELQWRAPAECATGADVRAELERIARVRPGFELAPISAQVEIEHQGRGYGLLLRSTRDGRTGERRLEAADCKTLVRAVTLVLALAFGPGVEVVAEGASAQPTAPDAPNAHPMPELEGSRPVAPDGEPSPGPDDATGETQSATDDDEEAAVDGDDIAAFAPDLALLVGGGAQLGVLPSAAFALSAGAQLSAGAWSLALRATALPGVTEQVVPDVRARFDGVAGALSGCGDLVRSAWALALCGGGRVGALRGRSSGASDDGTDLAPWYALTTAATATWPSAQVLGVRLEATAGLSLNRPRFVIAGLRPVHQLPRLFGELTLLLVVEP